MSTNTLNFATQNKWLATIPLSQILDDIQDVSLNLTTFAIPSIEINANTVNFKGIPIEVPGTVIQGSGKELTFNYIIDSEWKNYVALYSWVDNLSRLTKIVRSEDYSTRYKADPEIYKNFSLPVTVHLLNEYKQRVLEFKYHNCWIKGFSELSMSYTDEPTEISHSFTVAYSDFELIPIG
jgi:hypothetical protein